MFNFNDPANSNHKKVYQVTRVLNNTDYLTGGTRPGTQERIYYVTPSIEKSVIDTGDGNTPKLIATNPTFRVMQSSDVTSYTLGTNNLYEFGLSLEEIQP
jgi:hypothetical protein